MTRCRCLLVALLVCASSAGAAEHVDPNGFTLTYPNDWQGIPLDADSYAAAKRELPASLSRALDRLNFDPSRIHVMVARLAPDGFCPNVNVLSIDREMPLTQKSMREVSSALMREVAKAGLMATNPRVEMRALNGQQAVVLQYKVLHADFPEALQYTQAAFVGNGKTYVVTCCATQSQFKQSEPEFEAILGSFKTSKVQSPAGWQNLQNIFQWTPRAQAMVVRAAIVAIVILVLKMLFG